MQLTKKVGFLGGGAMAEAMISGMLHAEMITPDKIIVCEHKQARCEYLHNTYGITAGTAIEPLTDKADILVLAVKPQAAQAAINSVCNSIRKDILVISIIAGITLETLEESFTAQAIARVMPNTPMAVGEGMSAIALNSKASDKDADTVKSIFDSAGKALIIKESAMDAVTGLSGSGPGYAFVMIDALADAGVKAGLPRAASITLAAQTLLGAAKMVLETGKHPAVLRDMVTSPGGTTIAGVHVMEQKGVRAALIDAVEAAANKSKAMGKK